MYLPRRMSAASQIVLKATAGTSCNNTLLYIQSAVMNLIRSAVKSTATVIKAYKRLLLYIIEGYPSRLCIQFFDCVRIARMEWHRNHRFDR